jgi:hypothetical protein
MFIASYFETRGITRPRLKLSLTPAAPSLKFPPSAGKISL